MRIWVSDVIDYPDRAGIDGFFVSEEAAVRGLRERYGPPYKVEWITEREDDDVLALTGRFQHVQHYSTEHESLWHIYSVEVSE